MGLAYAGVLFDLDGTLIDSYELIIESMHYAVKTVLGHDDTDEELGKGIGTPLYSQMLEIAQGNEELATTLTSVYRGYNEAIHDQHVSAFSGISQALAALRDAGVAMGVVTSKRHALALRGVRVCGLEEYLPFIIGPDDCPEHKPEPGPVLAGCQQLGLEPSRCLYVGDSPYDLQSGSAAGCATVALSWGVFGREVLAAQNPTYFIDDPAQLVSIALGD